MSANFWSMGGYARFVWPCIGFALVVLAWNVWSALHFYSVCRLNAKRWLAMSESPRT